MDSKQMITASMVRVSLGITFAGMKTWAHSGYNDDTMKTNEGDHATLIRRPDTREQGMPRPALSVGDAVVVIVGIVVGAGIFRTPSLVAEHTGSAGLFLTIWLLGGIVSLIGALCYAELSTAFPNTGGDYYFLKRAFGKRFAFLFAWARMSVIQTGSIALLAYIVGDYISQLFPLGTDSPAIYAALVVVVLTLVNVLGVRAGTHTQKLLVGTQFAGLAIVLVTGLWVKPSGEVLDSLPGLPAGGPTAIGLAMVFVLLTFGGWNEAGYISAELRQGSRKMVRVLVLGITVITITYLLINMAFLHVLGIEKMAASTAPAVDLMRATWGEGGVVFIGMLVALAALTSVNATIFTGARTNYAMGRDFWFFSRLSKWDKRKSSPIQALLTQGFISLLLIGIGTTTRSGFESMVEFTAPVFWFFFLAVGIALFVLRVKEPGTVRPFKVPLYPVTPLLFCLVSAYLLYSSLMYTGVGALVGVAVLLAGLVLFFFIPKKTR